MAHVVYHPRSDSGLGTPTNNSGSVRPKLSPGLGIVTIHYTGVSVSYHGTNTAAKLKRLQEVALASGKSYEYNYVVAWDGVWEYAGDYQAAHSSGENGIAYGVLVFNGVHDPLTDYQLRCIQWLRDYYLKGNGQIRHDAATIPHNQMPKAATACPGNLILSRWGEILQPYSEDDTVDDEMLKIIAVNDGDPFEGVLGSDGSVTWYADGNVKNSLIAQELLDPNIKYVDRLSLKGLVYRGVTEPYYGPGYGGPRTRASDFAGWEKLV